jgi:hypothetical protein
MAARLLDAFAALFEGKPYLHRVSNQGDRLALELYEDLYDLGRSAKFRSSVESGQRGVGPRNRTVTLQRMRRGDGTFGQIIDPEKARCFPNHRVARGVRAANLKQEDHRARDHFTTLSLYPAGRGREGGRAGGVARAA